MAAIDSMEPDAYFNAIRVMIKELGFEVVVNAPASLPDLYCKEYAMDMGDYILLSRIIKPVNTLPYIRISCVKKYTQLLSLRQQGIIRYFRMAELYGQIVCYYMTPDLSQQVFHVNSDQFAGTRPILYYHHIVDLYDYPLSHPSKAAIQTIITCLTTRFRILLDTVQKAGNENMATSEPESTAEDYASIIGGKKPL